VFTAVVYVLTSGCAWRYPPESFGVSPATAHRRFSVWTEAGLWRRLHRAVLDEFGAGGALDWSSAIVDAASVRAKKGARGTPAAGSAIAASFLGSPGPASSPASASAGTRWKIERSIAWLFGYRRLTIRYERKATTSLPSSGSLRHSPVTSDSRSSPHETSWRDSFSET
jgi:transposase